MEGTYTRRGMRMKGQTQWDIYKEGNTYGWAYTRRNIHRGNIYIVCIDCVDVLNRLLDSLTTRWGPSLEIEQTGFGLGRKLSKSSIVGG